MINATNSIFDTIRSPLFKSNSEHLFSSISIDPDAILCEGNLWEISKSNSTELRHFILTKNSLVSSRIVDSEFSLESISNKQIRFYWPLMQKLNLDTFTGFQLISSDIILGKFLFPNNEESKIWLDSLKQVCIQQNLENDFIVKSKVGCGGSAVVRKGIHRKTGELAAIKCFEKNELLQKPSLLVFLYNFL